MCQWAERIKTLWTITRHYVFCLECLSALHMKILPGDGNKRDPERENWPCIVMLPILPIQSISGSRLLSSPGTWVSEKRFGWKLILSVVPLPRKNLDIVSLATKEMLMVPEKRYLLSDIHYMSSFCHPWHLYSFSGMFLGSVSFPRNLALTVLILILYRSHSQIPFMYANTNFLIMKIYLAFSLSYHQIFSAVTKVLNESKVKSKFFISARSVRASSQSKITSSSKESNPASNVPFSASFAQIVTMFNPLLGKWLLLDTYPIMVMGIWRDITIPHIVEMSHISWPMPWHFIQ